MWAIGSSTGVWYASPAKARIASSESKRVSVTNFDFAALIPTHHVGAAETLNMAHRREQLTEKKPLVSVGVLGGRPAAPESGDHPDTDIYLSEGFDRSPARRPMSFARCAGLNVQW
jgi:hypothetical protein